MLVLLVLSSNFVQQLAYSGIAVRLVVRNIDLLTISKIKRKLQCIKVLWRGFQAGYGTLVLIIAKDFFSPETIPVVLDIVSLFAPDTISAYGYLKSLAKHAGIFGHIDDHKLVALAASSTEGKVGIPSLDFEVKPLSI